MLDQDNSCISRNRYNACLLVVLYVLLSLNRAAADSNTSTNAIEAAQSAAVNGMRDYFPQAAYNTGRFIDSAQDQASTRISSTVQWVDSFFDDPDYVEEEARFRASLKQSVKFYRNSDPEFRTRVRGSIVLPNLNRKVRLSIEGNDDLYGEPGADALEDTLEESTNESVDDPSMRLQYFLLNRTDADLGLSGGIRFSDLSFYAGPRLKVRTDLGAGWESRFIQRVLWYTTNELRSKSEIRFDHLLGKQNLFRQAFRLDWDSEEHESDGFRINTATSITQPLGKDAAFRYSWSSLYLTRPDPRWTSTSLVISYRRSAIWDWLILELAPFVKWEEEYDWDTGGGVTFSLNIVFDR